mmetsp:Transcript_10272/g.33126  ORF Transcript_10272/g.33126 Transcript_10272/m.33126 type:complete len:102 (+) Transcript_10272:173-478(+)
MDDLQSNEEAAFVPDDVSNIIKESVDSVLQNAIYNHNKVGQWTSNVVENCLKKLTDFNKPFKYVVTTIIMQRNVRSGGRVLDNLWCPTPPLQICSAGGDVV